jgi:hypothetical protein
MRIAHPWLAVDLGIVKSHPELNICRIHPAISFNETALSAVTIPVLVEPGSFVETDCFND